MEVCSADGHDTQFWLLCVHFTIRRHLCWLAFNGVFLLNSIDGTSVLFFLFLLQTRYLGTPCTDEDGNQFFEVYLTRRFLLLPSLIFPADR